MSNTDIFNSQKSEFKRIYVKSQVLLCQIQTSLILKKVSLSVLLCQIKDIFNSQKGEFKTKNPCNY